MKIVLAQIILKLFDYIQCNITERFIPALLISLYAKRFQITQNLQLLHGLRASVELWMHAEVC